MDAYIGVGDRTPYNDFMMVREALLEADLEVEEAEEALDRIERALLGSLAELVSLRVGMLAHNEPEVPDLSFEVQGELLNEYRRLCTIEDAAKALLIGRLRDLPEEEMAGLWGNLVAAADAKGSLGADS
jgi:hypothetical protein